VRRVHHRGPEDAGSWIDPAHGLALGHARLKIQDLTDAAQQPMRTADGHGVLIFNGEIYNFHQLRDELRADGATFHSTGDTAVLLELCRRDPRMGFLSRLNGMFAFAYWDGASRTLTLARDRTGVKPLLWTQPDSGGIAFASEMHALRPAIQNPVIQREAMYQLLSLGFIAAPDTIFEGVSKLRPGHLLRYHDGDVEIKQWVPPPNTDNGTGTFEEAKEQVRKSLSDAVKLRLIADVPVGVFLSGGIDSAIITALGAKAAGQRIKTFSVCFPEEPFYDESRYSNAVARMYDTEHTVIPLTLAEIQDVIPTVQRHIGEPFADSSALPTYLLSGMTRKHVTVALSGDGADELFAGYNRYAAATLSRKYGWLAATPVYPALRRLIESMPARRETKIGGRISMLKRAIRSLDSDLRMRYANWMRTSDDRTLASLLHEPGESAAAIRRIADLLWQYRGSPKNSDNLNNHLLTEWQLSLPDDMLMKVDLMSMAHALEVRSPFLDFRLVDAVFPMDWRWKLNGYRKKHLLIEAFREDLPPELHNRPKKGFEVPVGTWLRGPLRGYAQELIDNDRCFFGSVLSKQGALRILSEHVSGRADHNFCLWALISLLAWQQIHAPGVAVSDKIRAQDAPRRSAILA
ncbi:MAG TPA: asparagine synthase (glutamine-hydrolyzing), partial [Phycisphaerae bacterium]|nr:asparagine synthase (glutamine-hydrolyzing) [Phycisphaerae bacterium]